MPSHMLIRGDDPCPQFPVFRLRRRRRPPSVLPCLFPSTVRKAAVAALYGRTAHRQASALCSACCAPPCSRSGQRFTSTAAAGTSTTPAPGAKPSRRSPLLHGKPFSSRRTKAMITAVSAAADAIRGTAPVWTAQDTSAG